MKAVVKCKKCKQPKEVEFEWSGKSYIGYCPDCGMRLSFVNLPKTKSTEAQPPAQNAGRQDQGGVGEKDVGSQPAGDEGEEITETEEESKTAEVPTSRTKEVADDFGVWRRLYIPYDVGFAFNRARAEGLTNANDLQSWLVECVELALEYAYGWRIVFEKVVSKDGRMKFLKEQNLSRDELLGLLKVGSISREEFNVLAGESAGE